MAAVSSMGLLENKLTDSLMGLVRGTAMAVTVVVTDVVLALLMVLLKSFLMIIIKIRSLSLKNRSHGALDAA